MSIHNFAATKVIGPFSIEDTGAPPQCSEYKLVVIVHGLAWPSGIFTRLLPFAPQHGARIILVNRRDYPGSTPFSDSEQQLLSSCLPTTAEAAQNMRSYMKDRSRELYHFLVEVATTEAIPNVSEKSGMIVVGWSLGSAWITALLAHLEEFEGAGIMLQSYARKFICLDPPYGAVGFPHYSDLRMPYDT
ncbi:uncharacterized protein STEHIDRAFT_161747 [Stereum hirsutum FP-91666 SS1]|uniref:uncharacterized protein n=1 Tax=Stereum hirsutum (strain FP-91666) TaxID=721885 RepID=UPI0004449C9E|nr:uncharacterized protein STEHIDRAFT_161747 [Stereum hirsutum FP-91666 SS1]EIM81568.1 hypothetical protein STEHIDRAFT_161747 [Stereum hirsutum FP-91666 SS1]